MKSTPVQFWYVQCECMFLCYCLCFVNICTDQDLYMYIKVYVATDKQKSFQYTDKYFLIQNQENIAETSLEK